jgi:hypothetical protein
MPIQPNPTSLRQRVAEIIPLEQIRGFEYLPTEQRSRSFALAPDVHGIVGCTWRSFDSSSASFGIPPQQAKTGLVGGAGIAQDFACGLLLALTPATRLKLRMAGREASCWFDAVHGGTYDEILALCALPI